MWLPGPAALQPRPLSANTAQQVGSHCPLEPPNPDEPRSLRKSLSTSPVSPGSPPPSHTPDDSSSLAPPQKWGGAPRNPGAAHTFTPQGYLVQLDRPLGPLMAGSPEMGGSPKTTQAASSSDAWARWGPGGGKPAPGAVLYVFMSLRMCVGPCAHEHACVSPCV